MKELMIMYHPVKKEIRFLAKVKGEFLDIPYKMCPNLSQYAPENGEFLLQNQGNQFFDDIWEQFSHDKINLVFKGTKVDYEDFVDTLHSFTRIGVVIGAFGSIISLNKYLKEHNNVVEND